MLLFYIINTKKFEPINVINLFIILLINIRSLRSDQRTLQKKCRTFGKPNLTRQSHYLCLNSQNCHLNKSPKRGNKF